MAKHLLLFVHGMGKPDAHFYEAGLKVLKAAFMQYPLLKENFSFDEQFEAMPIVYDNEFEQLRSRWRDDVDAIKDTLARDIDDRDADAKASVDKQIEELHDLAGSGPDNFFNTAAMDVLLYRFFRTVRMNVNIQVSNQIAQRIQGDGPDLPDWSVLAHSLGTAVVHNTLNAMYSTSFPNGATLRVQDTRPDVVMMIANVSRVLQLPSVPVLCSRVKPGSVLSGRCCRVYLNARHRLDPFMKPKPFDPDAWPDPVFFNNGQYQRLQPSHFVMDKLAGVHDLDHYLLNPRVHVPLFKSLLGDDFIPDGDFRKAKERFDAETASNNTADLRERLEKLQASLPDNWRAFLTILKKLKKDAEN